jgi:hypothetical protein
MLRVASRLAVDAWVLEGQVASAMRSLTKSVAESEPPLGSVCEPAHH